MRQNIFGTDQELLELIMRGRRNNEIIVENDVISISMGTQPMGRNVR